MTGPVRVRLGAALTIVGFCCHLVAANMIRAVPMAYTHHIEGFFLIAIATGVLIAALEWFFWRGRRDVTVLVFGAVQALMGFVVIGLTLNGYR